MRDIVSQNKELSAAGKTPKDTSPRVDKALNDSASVSSSKNPQSDLSINKAKIAESTARITKAKPSYEGYMNSPSAHISMNNSRYLNTRVQKARYKEKPIQKFVENKNNLLGSFNNQQNSAIINRHVGYNSGSLFEENSSSQRIAGIINNNNLI